MVDMVEARKRAKKKRESAERVPQQDTNAEPPASHAKPVLRAETTSDQPISAYIPVETPQSPEQKTPKHDIIPTQSVPEDQVDFLQKLMMQHPEDEDEKTAEVVVPEENLEVLVFQLGGESYGIDIQQIAEIIRFIEPTEVPNAAAYLDGIISFRGKMVPVINGRKRLGHDLRIPDQKSRIIILQEDHELQGILVDSASKVLKLPKKSIEPTPPVVAGVDAEFIGGVCEFRNQFVILLQLEKFLRM